MESTQSSLTRISVRALRSPIFHASAILGTVMTIVVGLIGASSTWGAVAGIVIGVGMGMVPVTFGFVISLMSLWRQDANVNRNQVAPHERSCVNDHAFSRRIRLGIGFPLGFVLMFFTAPSMFGILPVFGWVLYCLIPFAVYGGITVMIVVVSRLCRALSTRH